MNHEIMIVIDSIVNRQFSGNAFPQSSLSQSLFLLFFSYRVFIHVVQSCCQSVHRFLQTHQITLLTAAHSEISSHSPYTSSLLHPLVLVVLSTLHIPHTLHSSDYPNVTRS